MIYGDSRQRDEAKRNRAAHGGVHGELHVINKKRSKTMTKGYIHSLESFGSVDGPGVRYLIFTTGCAMRCQFCHNPDTWNMNSGTLYTADELIDKAWKYRTYWGSKGGITVSGGEPLLQIDFLLELFQKAKERGINTTLDTCGNPFTREEPFFSKFQELMKVTDLVMLDIKHIDDEQHKILTGQTNKNILDMARYLSDTGKPVWIRHVLVPERSDKDEYLHRLHDFIETLDNVEKVEVLPYHTLGVYKWKELGIPYQLEGIDPPSKERVENANRILETAKYHA
jgi:pyruvate formate lyase activating enzyme